MNKRSVVIGAGVALTIVLSLAAVGYFSYRGNTTPRVAPIEATEAARPTKFYVVKLHAQWCPVCMLTKDVWRQIESEYAGRVNLVVFDFTNEATTEAGRVEAERLGLQKFFAETEGWTGTVAVVNPHSNEVVDAINGSRDFEDYRRTIDSIISLSPGSTPQ